MITRVLSLKTAPISLFLYLINMSCSIYYQTSSWIVMILIPKDLMFKNSNCKACSIRFFTVVINTPLLYYWPLPIMVQTNGSISLHYSADYWLQTFWHADQLTANCTGRPGSACLFSVRILQFVWVKLAALFCFYLILMIHSFQQDL